jgi:hypothetical protein
MFVGHYGVAFAVKTPRNKISLWVLFVAVQLLDFLWAPFVLFGIEKVRFVPGITATNALDLYYMPYTHSLIGALFGRLWRLQFTKSAGATLLRTARRCSWVSPSFRIGFSI